MLILTLCPECEAPAEITERFSLPSTHGPVDHVVLYCAAGHHFRMPSELLGAPPPEQRQPRSVSRPARS